MRVSVISEKPNALRKMRYSGVGRVEPANTIARSKPAIHNANAGFARQLFSTFTAHCVFAVAFIDQHSRSLANSFLIPVRREYLLSDPPACFGRQMLLI